MARDAEARTLNSTLVSLREAAGLSQQELADALNELAARRFGKHPNITKKTAGRWERGEVAWPQPFYRRLLAEYFGCATDELGFRRPARGEPMPMAVSAALSLLVPSPTVADPAAAADQKRWRAIRAELGQHRRQLAVAAALLYPEFQLPGLERTGVIAPPEWIPQTPVPLGGIQLELNEAAAEPAVTGVERESAPLRPLLSSDRRYRRYSHAVRDLSAPRLFENRLCWRLLSVNFGRPELRFGVMGFFDAIDTNEALAHEMAMEHLVRDQHGEITVSRPSWRRLAFRKLVGNPFDLSRRPLMGAIGTLTIRSGESPSMVLHDRDTSRVAGGGSMIHLLPAGVFQPSSVLPASGCTDFSIWRNIQREFAEELLGMPECDGTARPCEYERLEPFVTLDNALASGQIRIYCLGLVLDALTLACDLLTVAVIEPELYDDVFRDAVDSNDEGTVPTRALPFEAHTITRLRELDRLSPGSAAAIELAWNHRSTLLHGVSASGGHA